MLKVDYIDCIISGVSHVEGGRFYVDSGMVKAAGLLMLR